MLAGAIADMIADICLVMDPLLLQLWQVDMAESTDMESLEDSFRKFAIYGDTKATGQEMNGKNWAKLCKDCKVTDGKNVTSTDVDIVFSKVK